MSKPLLSINGLSKTYNDGDRQHVIFDQYDLVIAPAETVALTGPSGSGKSTLLNMIAGVLLADAGAIELTTQDNGEVVRYGQRGAGATTALRRCHIGYVFQFFNLVPTLTVRENLLLSLRLARRPQLLPRALARIEQMGLGHRLDAFPDALSGGEQQRAAIARALAPEPELVLADEPTGNLDAANAEQVIGTLWRAVSDCGCALLVATHDPRIAERALRQVDLSC